MANSSVAIPLQHDGQRGFSISKASELTQSGIQVCQSTPASQTFRRGAGQMLRDAVAWSRFVPPLGPVLPMHGPGANPPSPALISFAEDSVAVWMNGNGSGHARRLSYPLPRQFQTGFAPGSSNSSSSARAGRSCWLPSHLSHRVFDVHRACAACCLRKLQLPGKSAFHKPRMLTQESPATQPCGGQCAMEFESIRIGTLDFLPLRVLQTSRHHLTALKLNLPCLICSLAVSFRHRCTRPHPWQSAHGFLSTRISLSAEATPRKCPPPCAAR